MAMRPQDPHGDGTGLRFETHAATWTIYKVAAKQTRLGEVEAADEREAVDKAAKEFGQHPSKLIAVRRSQCTDCHPLSDGARTPPPKLLQYFGKRDGSNSQLRHKACPPR